MIAFADRKQANGKLDVKDIGGYTVLMNPVPEVVRKLEQFSQADRELLAKVLTETVEFVDNPMFHDKTSAEEFEKGFSAAEPDLAACEAQLYGMDLFEEQDRARTAFKPLNHEQENRLFLKLNYARYRINRAMKRARGKPLMMDTVNELLRWRKAELATRSQITQANIPLVLGMAKKIKPGTVEFTELVGEGNMALVRSVDKFDCARGFKFSTYACRSILKSFSRVAMMTHRYRNRFPVAFDPCFEKSGYLEQRREDTRIFCLDRIRYLLGNSSQEGELSEIEKQVLRARFGIRESAGAEKAMTLEEVGKVIKVSKERVRQIQNKAMKKLRMVLEENVLCS
jgi:RNA polymerase primary sigma factor